MYITCWCRLKLTQRVTEQYLIYSCDMHLAAVLRFDWFRSHSFAWRLSIPVTEPSAWDKKKWKINLIKFIFIIVRFSTGGEQYVAKERQIWKWIIFRHPSVTKQNGSLSRRDAVIMNRLQIGYTRATHAHLFGNDDQVVCTTCFTSLTNS